MRTVGGLIKTLAVLTQTFDNESYEATESKPFVIYISISLFKKTSMSIHIRTESYMLTAYAKTKKRNVASRVPLDTWLGDRNEYSLPSSAMNSSVKQLHPRSDTTSIHKRFKWTFFPSL